MKESFSSSMQRLAVHEGLYSNHPDDPGGATMKGVTQGRYDSYRKLKGLERRSVRQMTDVEMKEIYKKFYWDAVRGDELPLGLDYVVFDGGVNSGPGQSAKWLQRAIGVPVDGIIGVTTLAKLEELQADEDKAGDRIIDSICDQRLAFVRGLRNYPSFAKGWERRIREVRKAGKAMNNHMVAEEPTPIPADEQAKAPPSETRLPQTPEGDILIKQGSSWGLATIMTWMREASDYIAVLTGLPPKVVETVATIGLLVGVVAIIGFTAYGIYSLIQKRRRGDLEVG
jgi:lysozyme family protein